MNVTNEARAGASISDGLPHIFGGQGVLAGVTKRPRG